MAFFRTDLIVKSFTNFTKFIIYFSLPIAEQILLRRVKASIILKFFFCLKAAAKIRNTAYTLTQTRNRKSYIAQLKKPFFGPHPYHIFLGPKVNTGKLFMQTAPLLKFFLKIV